MAKDFIIGRKRTEHNFNGGDRVERTLYFPQKVDGYGIGRKNCKAYLTVAYNEMNLSHFKGVCISISGGVKNHLETDSIRCGQCLDYLKEFKSIANNETFLKLYDIWTKYHLSHETPQDVIDYIVELVNTEE